MLVNPGLWRINHGACGAQAPGLAPKGGVALCQSQEKIGGKKKKKKKKNGKKILISQKNESQ